MSRIPLWVFIVLIAGRTHGQQLQLTQLMAPACSAYEYGQEDIRGIGINPATLASIHEAQVALGSERLYMFPEAALYAVKFGMPTRLGNFGLQGTYLGSVLYNESQLSLAYGIRLSEHIAIGAAFNYQAIKVAGYGSAAIPGANAGLLIRLPDKMVLGVAISNPFGGRFGKDKSEKLPFTCRVGMGYTLTGSCFLSAELVKEEDQPVNARFALGYRFVDRCAARVGFNTAYAAFWTGIALNLNRDRFCIELGTSYHLQLGASPGIVLFYKIKSGEE
jgi:hypothetical protein